MSKVDNSNKKLDPRDVQEDLEEQSLRARMDAAEKDRQKRQKERNQRKKDRRNRVEKIMNRPIPLTEDQKLEQQKDKILEELERREKILEEKMKAMGNKITEDSAIKTQELEDNLVNSFIKKIAMDNYNKLEDQLKQLSTSLNTKYHFFMSLSLNCLSGMTAPSQDQCNRISSHFT